MMRNRKNDAVEIRLDGAWKTFASTTIAAKELLESHVVDEKAHHPLLLSHQLECAITNPVPWLPPIRFKTEPIQTGHNLSTYVPSPHIFTLPISTAADSGGGDAATANMNSRIMRLNRVARYNSMGMRNLRWKMEREYVQPVLRHVEYDANMVAEIEENYLAFDSIFNLAVTLRTPLTRAIYDELIEEGTFNGTPVFVSDRYMPTLLEEREYFV